MMKTNLFYIISIKLCLSANDYRNKTQNGISVKRNWYFVVNKCDNTDVQLSILNIIRSSIFSFESISSRLFTIILIIESLKQCNSDTLTYRLNRRSQFLKSSII